MDLDLNKKVGQLQDAHPEANASREEIVKGFPRNVREKAVGSATESHEPQLPRFEAELTRFREFH